MEAGALFNQGYLGQGFSWWIGQVPDDSTWRDNIIPGKFDNKEQVEGWGRRYKVRIIGLHDQGEESLKSDQLPWAQVMYPITAGGGQGEVYQTPGIRQGNFVFGFFMDGPDGQVPVIMGILGNNTQTALMMATSLQGSSPKAPNFSPISGFAPTVVEKEATKEYSPEEGLTARRPTTQEVAKEEASNILEQGFQPTASQQADIDSAKQSLDKLEEIWKAQGKTLEEIATLSSAYVISVTSQGIKNRMVEANTPGTAPKPGPTKENSDNPHLVSAIDVILEDKLREKIVLMKPNDIVGSSIKATQTEMDNLAKLADKFFKSQQEFGYIESVSNAGTMESLKREMENSSKQIAKYMKVPFNKMMEYTNKSLNKELQGKVSSIPSCFRFQLADVTDMTGESMLESYGKITNGLGGQILSIMDKMFDLDGVQKKVTARVNDINAKKNIITSINTDDEAKIAAAYVEFAHRAPTRDELEAAIKSTKSVDELVSDISTSSTVTGAYNWKDDIQLTVPKVPVCTAEDLLGRVMYSNKGAIDRANESTITFLNSFLDDIKSQIGGAEGSPSDLPVPTKPQGAILAQNDEEVLNQTRGGSLYKTSENVPTYWYTNINPGITTSAGRGATVNIGVSTGGLGGFGLGSGFAVDISWIDRGTGYPATGTGPANAIDCAIIGSGTGSGMKVNVVTSGGEITNMYVHTTGTNYEPNTMLRINAGNFDAQFVMNEVYGAVDPGGIRIVDGGSQYQVGDVIAVANNGNIQSLPATFTITSTNDPGDIKAGGGGKSLADIIGLIGNMSGNVSAALNFENIKTNIFPFELPANAAVSDLYQFAKGGSGTEEPQMPSFGAVGDFVNKVGSVTPEKLKEVIPDVPPALPFVQPSAGEPDLVFDGPNEDLVDDQPVADDN